MSQQGKYERISSGFMLLFAFVFTIYSYKTGLGNVRHPGPGLIPFLTGVLLFAVSLLVFIRGAKRGQKATDTPSTSFKRVTLTVIVLGASLLLFSFLGFLLTTFLLMLSFFLITESRLRLKSIYIAATTAFVTYLVFSVALSIQFPKGFFGF